MSALAATLLQDPEALQPPVWSQIALKLLDWPFLLFLILLVLITVFRVHLAGLFSRGDIRLSWGDRSIQLTELSQNLDQELDPIRDEIEGLKKELARLGGTAGAVAELDSERERRLEAARNRVSKALHEGKFDWRSIERLAAIGGVDEDEVLDLLRADPEVVLGKGKDGRSIAGLRARVVQ